MNEQMQEALIKLIEKAQSGIDTSVSFLSAEIPDVVHQLLLWYAVKSAVLFAFFLLIIVCGVHVFSLKQGITKAEAQAAYDRGEAWTRYTAWCGVTSTRYDGIMAAPFEHFTTRLAGLIICAIGSTSALQNMEWLQIMIAPKIWLIEYAASLAK